MGVFDGVIGREVPRSSQHCRISTLAANGRESGAVSRAVQQRPLGSEGTLAVTRGGEVLAVRELLPDRKSVV